MQFPMKNKKKSDFVHKVRFSSKYEILAKVHVKQT
jgi:hypothetical protein